MNKSTIAIFAVTILMLGTLTLLLQSDDASARKNITAKVGETKKGTATKDRTIADCTSDDGNIATCGKLNEKQYSVTCVSVGTIIVHVNYTDGTSETITVKCFAK